MKTLILLLTILLAEISVNGAIGQLPIGSSNVVETYNFTNCTFAQSSVRWTKTNGVTAYWFGGQVIPSMTKTQLCAFNQQFLTNQLSISVESDPQADRSKPVTLSILYNTPKCPYWLLSTRSQTVSYSVTQTAVKGPDLSGIDPYGGDQALTIAIKDLKWARFEVIATNNPSQLYYVIDSRTQTNPPTSSNPNGIEKDNQFNWGCLTMALPFARSGTNGAYRVKTYLVSGTNNDYEIFDSIGLRVPETPLLITNFALVGGAIKLDVTGGDIGKVFTIQKSTDMLNWTTCVNTTNTMSSERICHISMPKGREERLFFRVKALALAPTGFSTSQPWIESLTVASDVQFDVFGADGSKFVVEKSVNLRTWTQYPTTNTIAGGITHVTLARGLESQAYFRIKSVQ